MQLAFSTNAYLKYPFDEAAARIAGIGYALGANYRRFDHGFKYAEYLVIAGVVLAAAYLLYRWATVGRRRASDTAD